MSDVLKALLMTHFKRMEIDPDLTPAFLNFTKGVALGLQDTPMHAQAAGHQRLVSTVSDILNEAISGGNHNRLREMIESIGALEGAVINLEAYRRKF